MLRPPTDPKEPSLDKSGRSSGLRNGLEPLRLAVPKKRLCFFEERLRDSLQQPCAKKD